MKTITATQAANLATRIHVFYTDPRNGWAAMALDAEGNQIGDACYSYRKADAMSEACRHSSLPIHVFGKNGLLQRILEPCA
jgi:hypothetical protein